MNRTEICNLALSYIARGRIEDIDEETEEARQCRIHYDHCRRRLLKAYTWGFARRIVQLAELTERVPHYKHAYAYPAGCIDVQLVFDENNAEDMEEDRNDFEISATTANNRAILTDVDNAWCRFTYDIEDTDMYSEEFVEALARLLASSIALPLDGSVEIQNINYQLANNAMRAAALSSAVEQERRTRYSENYSNARFR